MPALHDFPERYIHEPWNAPLTVQRKANCVIGEDYPDRMVDHIKARQICVDRLREFHKELVHPSKLLLNLTFFKLKLFMKNND